MSGKSQKIPNFCFATLFPVLDTFSALGSAKPLVNLVLCQNYMFAL